MAINKERKRSSTLDNKAIIFTYSEILPKNFPEPSIDYCCERKLPGILKKILKTLQKLHSFLAFGQRYCFAKPGKDFRKIVTFPPI